MEASEAKVRDAERNLATCFESLNAYRQKHGSVANNEVIALAQVQAVVGQAYATLAMAKAGLAVLAVQEPASGGDAA